MPEYFCRFYHDDLQPNIGLFWYFFTEMFEHFRSLFLYTFQMNATVLYLLPLSLRLYKQPMLLATILTALTTIFRSYPCIGDVAFYMALFPLWRKSLKCKIFASYLHFVNNEFMLFLFFSFGQQFYCILLFPNCVCLRPNCMVFMDLL